MLYDTVGDLSFLYGTILYEDEFDQYDKLISSNNVCIFADAEMDRSPCGSGVSARMALLASDGVLAPDRHVQFKSPTHGMFAAKLEENSRELKVGEFPAITSAITGKAFYCGRSSFVFEVDDPLIDGFLIK
jgi:proline racemase